MAKRTENESNEDLEQTVKKMLPGRRSVLAGGAAAGAALLGASGSASADGLNDGGTQWGSDTNRDDYVVDHVDANSVDTGDLSTEERPVADVTAYGADPNDASSDDTTAFDDAFNAAKAVNGVVRIPSGDYSVSNIPDIDTPMSVVGQGKRDVTVINYTGTGDALTITSDDVRLQGFDLVRDGSKDVDGIVMPSTGGERSRYVNVRAEGFDNAWTLTDVWQSTWIHCDGFNSVNGIYVDSGGGNRTFIACRFSQNDDHGVYIYRSESGMAMIGCAYENNGLTGIWAGNDGQAVNALRIIAPYEESNTGYAGMRFYPGVDGLLISAPFTNSPEGIELRNCSNVTVTSGGYYNNATHSIQLGEGGGNLSKATFHGPITNTNGGVVFNSVNTSECYHYDETGGTAL